MKTVYIPAGATYNYETLVTDDVIVHGHLHVTNGLKAKHISGRGFITAGEVSADIVDVTELECGTVICRRLLAQRVSCGEAMISESAAVSRFFSANYVKAPSLTVAVSEIGEADVDEIVHLTPKPRGNFICTHLISESIIDEAGEYEHPVNEMYAGLIDEETLSLLIWIYCEGTSYQEAADRLGISLNACKKRIQRAKIALKRAIEKNNLL